MFLGSEVGRFQHSLVHSEVGGDFWWPHRPFIHMYSLIPSSTTGRCECNYSSRMPVRSLPVCYEHRMGHLDKRTTGAGIIQVSVFKCDGLFPVNLGGAATRSRFRFALTRMAISGGSALIQNVRSIDRKSTRLNSSHLGISYAVFCLKKK